ncbi:MAG: alpha/beta hydrolase [Alphaproteobacteria bacterium]|nr:alpha/beta hydrolase [Alphaproteobacteria bacterium]MDE2335861.1 alpha/beta hydrolase [Alphaproteobacteria bacterium]
MNRRTVPFSFDNSRGQILAGLLDLPAGTPLFYGVYAPCFTCTRESHAAHKVCRALSERGVAMLRFDHTGLGASEGDFAETSFSTRIGDIISACDALVKAHGAPKLLFGHSISGTAALAAAAQIPFLQAVATLGAPADPRHVIRGLRKTNDIAIENGMAKMTITGRTYAVKEAMVDDMETYDMTRAMAAVDKRLFIFHAPHDAIVPFRNAEEIRARAVCESEIIPLSESATHLLERGDADAAFIAETLAEWFALHLE